MSQISAVAIIYNPNSTGDAENNARELQSELRTALSAVPVKLLPTERAGHAVDLAYEFARQNDSPLIIAASGDGGYNEVINGALRAQDEGRSPICAVLPSGNANDHARTMHDAPLIELIQKGVTSRLDILQVTTTHDGEESVRYAHSYIGLGLTPSIAVELNKHTLNSLTEAWIVLRTFWGLRPVKIRVDGKVLALDSLICSTIPEMAKLITISETAEPDDGLFELTTFPRGRKLTLIFRLIKGVFKTLGQSRRLKSYSCTVLVDTPLQLDGEVMKLKQGCQLHVSLLPRRLRTFV